MIRNVVNWHEYLLHKVGVRSRNRFVFRLRAGIEVDVPREMLFTFKEVFFTDDYIRGLPAGLFGRKPITVVDVGANAGYFSLFAFARFPGARVIALEPIDTNFRLLEKNRELNRELDWTLVQRAVSSTPGKIVLSMSPDDTFTTDATVFDNERGNKRVEVEAVSLAQVMDDHAIGEIDYLKLDCEGSEYEILYEAPADVLDRVRTIVVETHPGPGPMQNRDALAGHLKSVGYSLVTEPGAFIWAWR